MRPISPAALDRLNAAYPDIARQIERMAAKKPARSRAASIEIPFARFEDDFLLLYAALWYATSKGVTVTILPAPLSAPSPPAQIPF